ncbi:MAG TPA: Rieske 2Fe-2S domain-containing protein [Aggregatilineales bacterium]|nr:Rieske 2Fe-2S domain-containing protein [Aggregatilineales bacterium]
MATTQAAQGRTAAVARTPAATAGAEEQTQGVSRREFLNYIWGASMALLLAETTGAIVWFALPRFRAGEFGGVFNIDPSVVPPKGQVDMASHAIITPTTPVGITAGKFWLSNSNEGLLAMSMVCTHLGCLFKWVPAHNQFECPCHGSHFTFNGWKKAGEGPAQRNLDRFAVTVTTPGGTATTNADGNPVKADGATSIAVNTGKKILGKSTGQSQ